MTALRTVLALVGGLLGLVALTPVILVGLLFWLPAAAVRGVARIRSARSPRPVEWSEVVEFEPEIGWRTRPSVDAWVSGHRDFRVVTDADGARGRGSVDDCDVMVLGDSFAFGHCARPGVFFAERDASVSIKSLGCNGYSMVQSLLWLERLAPRLRGKLVVWLVYYGNDLYDNLMPYHRHYRMPFVRQAEGDGGWEVVTSHVDSGPWPFPDLRSDQRRLAEICAGGHVSERAFGACEYLIGRAEEICRRVGAELAVMGVPEKWQLSESGRRALRKRSPDPERFDASLPDRRLAEICDATGARFVALSDHLLRADYLDGDSHWRESGHVKVTALLERLHAARGAPGTRRTAAASAHPGAKAR